MAVKRCLCSLGKSCAIRELFALPKVIDAISAILPYIYLSVRIGNFVDNLYVHDAYSSVK